MNRTPFCHRLTLVSAICASLAMWPGPTVFAGDKPASAYEAERKHAFELCDQYKMVEAMPLLQKLATENPNDIAVWERLGMAMLNYANTIDDPQRSKLARAKARAIFVKAKELGDNSNLVSLFAEIPEDGGDVQFSPREEVNKAMQMAEADFAKGDFDKAIQGYTAALTLDPKLYDAALFTGDVYFKQGKQDLAGEWFARAIKIDPDRETAYRYWGDSLVAAKKMKEAREKFIEAVTAEPYRQRSWVGLSQWAEKIGEKLHHSKLHELASAEIKDGQLNLGLTPDSKGKTGEMVEAAWLAYGLQRATWQAEKFKQQFPNESAYRFTSVEEADCLHMLVTVLQDEKNGVPASGLEPALAELVNADKANMLLPYVFLFRATESIARDYPAYRASHRDELRRHLDKFVVPAVD